ncbi:putative glycosyl transferase [Lachnellula subtilissima]|uniref:Putative glycosyl transferase n=1 Tax=Lachnellula subtilissima TaxID=602034 RepID=A0A8H8RTY2_9HELO|nr:putative glycosyl transferase [Lachnellula subtilissima]
MDTKIYSMPKGMHAIPGHLLDLRPDAEVDHDLLHPKPVTDEKNLWLFWHSGFKNMHPYTQRNIRAWHRRFSPQGWAIRVMDRLPSSPLNVANFLDIADPGTFPRAFVDGTIGGDYAPQHNSDLVRWPLLLKYGGVYADVGLMQLGDLDRMWSETIRNPASPFDVLSYNIGGVEERNLTNYFLASGRDNPPLLRGVPLLGQTLSFEENGKKYGPEETSRMLTDYITQGQVMSMVMGLIDEEGCWDGPRYCADRVYAIDYMVGSQLINEITAWDGTKAFRLMSLSLATDGEVESSEQEQAREIVEACLQKSFGFKLAHGMILRVLGQTLGSLWRKHDGSDNVQGTYAHWLRHGTMYWNQDEIPPRMDFQVIEPFKIGPLLREK